MKSTHDIGPRRNRALGRMYALLDRPSVYRLARRIFAPGAIRAMDVHVQHLIADLPSADTVLDVGCGPTSPLFSTGLLPVGVDVTPSYIRAYTQHGAPGVLGSAEALPFGTESFDGVWASGMIHHVPDNVAIKCMREMIRVCRPKGYVVVLEAVLPKSPARRPLAYLVRRMDRGGFIHTQERFETLLPERNLWSIERSTYTITGLEMLTCIYRKREGILR